MQLKTVATILTVLVIVSTLATLSPKTETAQPPTSLNPSNNQTSYGTTTAQEMPPTENGTAIPLSYPSDGQVSYGSTVWSNMPWTRKEEVIPAFISLANQYGGTYESIGKSSGSNWDIILFKFGNSSGHPVMIDSYLHGNEFYGEEVVYSLIKWLLTSSDTYATQILDHNYILVVPVVNYRWGRTNYDSPSWMTANDPSNDGDKCGVNLDRNFGPNWPSSLSHSNTDSYSGTAANSEKEVQALINAWNEFHPRVYWDLHQGATPFTWSAATTSQAKTDANNVRNILPSIQSDLNLTTKWAFTIYDRGGDGISYDGAASHGTAGFMTEIMSGWDNAATKRNSLDSGDTFKQIKAMFIAMCTAVE